MRTPFRKLLAVLAVVSVIPACGQEAIDCIGTAIGSAFTRSIQIGNSEALLFNDRPDDVRTAHGQLWISGFHESGRLLLTFDGPTDSGTLPRQVAPADGGCQSTGDFAFFIPGDGGVSQALSATVAVTHMARTDAGVPSQFRVTGISQNLQDGGMRPISNRDLNVVLP